MSQFIDITGKQFGRLSVLGPQIRKRRLIHWLCRCECGTEKWVYGQTLREGTTKSCGCLQREAVSKRTLKNISGKRFGRLIVLDQHKIKGTSGYWLCRCDCGKEKWISTSALKSRATVSCGCFNRELLRKAILEQRKRYKVVLSLEQRKDLKAVANRGDVEKSLRADILLLADQSKDGPSLTDAEIAKALTVSPDKVYYVRAIISDPNFSRLRSEYSHARLKDPRARARALRLASLRKYEQKPATKELKKQYVKNLPLEVRVRKNIRAKIYRQTPQGKATRKKELERQKEWRKTMEGKLRTRQWTEKYRPRVRRRYKERYQNDAQFRISVSLRKRLSGALKAQNIRKSARTAELIGCSIKKLAAYLEQKFKSGMSWENYGSWHIDHIIPCSKFDLVDPLQQRKCFHFSNLQPLWAAENIVKSNKLLTLTE